MKPLRPLPLTWLLTWLLLTACAPGVQVPMPDFTRVEAGVVAKVKSCHAAVLKDPSAKNWAKYGRTLHAHSMMPEAESAYLAAAEAAGEGKAEAFEHLHLAGCAALEGHLERSIEHFQKALLVNDDYLPTHLCLAIASERLGKADLARRHYQRVLTAVESSHARLGLGRLALRDGDARAAIEQFDKALAAKPKHREVYEAKARAHARLKEMDKSRAAAKLAGNLAETTPYVDRLLGKVMAEAVDVNTRFSRGSRHAKKGRDAKAIAEFSAVVNARPRHIEARYLLAFLYKRTGAFDEAMTHLNLILEQNSRHLNGLEQRARILLKRGNKSAAERDLQAILKIDPKHAWAKSQ